MSKIQLVIKIGSMALINREYRDIDYNIFARLSKELQPGYLLVSSGATEIGRIDYMSRHGRELCGDSDELKMDYASQGQAILMENYRRFADPSISVRQVLLEYQHLSDEVNREILKRFFERCPDQRAVPIVNYNDAVSYEENRKMEISLYRSAHKRVIECVDNDETASQIACMLGAEKLLILTGTDGIYRDPNDPDSLIREVTGSDRETLSQAITACQAGCKGASRKGANGAWAKLEYCREPALLGVEVLIANSRYPIADILSGNAPCTKISLQN